MVLHRPIECTQLTVSLEPVGLPSAPRNLGRKADVASGGSGWNTHERKNQNDPKIRGSFKGAVTVPLHSLTLFFSDLASHSISRKSLRFHPLLFSIPTAPTKVLCFQSVRSARTLNWNKGFAQGHASTQRSLKASRICVVLAQFARARNRTGISTAPKILPFQQLGNSKLLAVIT
jgi:hypothetical protein